MCLEPVISHCQLHRVYFFPLFNKYLKPQFSATSKPDLEVSDISRHVLYSIQGQSSQGAGYLPKMKVQ